MSMFKQLYTISNWSQLSRVDIKGDTELQTLGYIFTFFSPRLLVTLFTFSTHKCKILICKVELAVRVSKLNTQLSNFSQSSIRL